MSKNNTPDTERHDPRFDGIEDWPVADMLAALAEGQAAAIQAVHSAIAPLAQAVEAAAERLSDPTGRIVYAGAGTSGRLAILDGIELTPTFGWPQERCVFLFAGGMGGLQKAVEGAEDDTAAAKQDVANANLGPQDVVIGIAASGTTPYTRQVVQTARAHGALTIAMANNSDAPLLGDAQIAVLLKSGPEVLAGSTRLGAGTSQKAALNLFSTALMARLNKIYRGLMVDVQPTNDKLVARAERMIMDLTHCDTARAQSALVASQYHVKTAVLIVKGASLDEARAHLHACDGHLGKAIARLAS